MRFWNRQPAVVEEPSSLDAFTSDAGLVREAYERGRKDERSRRRDSPLLVCLVVLLALAGAVALTTAATHGGSFAEGGAAIDRALGRSPSSLGEYTPPVGG
ncbi:hypothetical protein [Caulobacter sp. NIBR2454]|uniref:hypothetical protein n=1 Tax=Caulobacter sp. NIBR2454 TaxID=3015996 RepID=UPI0022B66A3D|nr:hypothetical protein [Caulobacter sp. NIBR2454]